MAFNPFASNDEDTSFEQGSPIQRTTTNAVKASASQIQQQQKAFTKSVVDQLYGPTEPKPEEPKKEQPPGMHTIQKQLGNGHEGDDKQLEETRKKLQELQKHHKENYFEKTMGEEAHRRIEQEEKQKEQLRLQAEQEEKEREEQEKAAQEQSLGGVMPQGKTSGPGRQRMQKPVALELAKTKTESNRGTTG